MTKPQTTFNSLIQQISQDYWLMLVLVFLMKAGQFMLLPFLAIFLATKTHATPAMIGLAIGLGPIAYALSGPFWGYLVDRLGAHAAISISVFFAALLFIIFNLYDTVFYITCINIAVGFSRSLFDTATRSYRIHDMNLEQRKLAISLRFTCVNAAAALGPAVSVNFIFKGASALFISVGISYLILSIWAWFLLKNKSTFFKPEKPLRITKVFGLLCIDKRLLAITLGVFLFWIGYAQLETLWPLYLHQQLSQEGIKIFTIAIVINGLGCASLQLPVSRFLRYIAHDLQIILGTIFFVIAYGILMLSLHLSWIITASVLIVLAESMLGPLSDLLTYTIAPKALIGSYYGALAFASLGIGVGPILGGYLYNDYGFHALFATCIGAFILMGILFWFVAYWNKNQNNVAA